MMLRIQYQKKDLTYSVEKSYYSDLMEKKAYITLSAVYNSVNIIFKWPLSIQGYNRSFSFLLYNGTFLKGWYRGQNYQQCNILGNYETVNLWKA